MADRRRKAHPQHRPGKFIGELWDLSSNDKFTNFRILDGEIGLGTNPFARGAGTPPPKLAGHDELRETIRIRAMAELGPGPHRSGDIAAGLHRPVSSFGPIRQLIAKGMIWGPGHGDTAFTVPLFDAFMRRIMPGEDWRE